MAVGPQAMPPSPHLRLLLEREVVDLLVLVGPVDRVRVQVGVGLLYALGALVSADLAPAVDLVICTLRTAHRVG